MIQDSHEKETWRPSATLEALQARAELLSRLRGFFSNKSILEVETPICAQAAGTDPEIEPFETSFQGPGYPEGLKLYLQTSPEYAMKRLLASGTGPIYQITKAFRNEEAGRFHNPEFTMLEWYRPGFNQFQLMDEVVECIQVCLERHVEPQRLTYSELFQEYVSLDPLTSSRDGLLSVLEDHGVEPNNTNDLSIDVLLDLLMVQLIEPQLREKDCVFVHDFPASKASLARLDPENRQVAQRFELYLHGVEVANGFRELADVNEQRRRFELDNLKRLANQQTTYDLDEHLLAALDHGLPDCSGVALGIDRLLMVKLGLPEISKTLAFPIGRA